MEVTTLQVLCACECLHLHQTPKGVPVSFCLDVGRLLLPSVSSAHSWAGGPLACVYMGSVPLDPWASVGQHS